MARRTTSRRSYGRRSTAARTTRGRSYTTRRRGTARRATRSRSSGRTQTIRIVVDTGQHSGASLGTGGMVKPAPKPRQARF